MFPKKWLLYVGLAAQLFVQGQFFQGCSVPARPALLQKQQFIYDGILWEGNKGQLSPLLFSVRFKTPGFIAAGSLQVKGKITPDPAGLPVPTKVRCILKRKAPGGAVNFTKTLELKIQPNGVIPLQTIPLATRIAIKARESVEFYFIAVDRNMPFGDISVTATYLPPPAAS